MDIAAQAVKLKETYDTLMKIASDIAVEEGQAREFQNLKEKLESDSE